jgi:hypothetical protein
MTAPNIKKPIAIKGKTVTYAVTQTLASALSNPASSNQVFKINSIFCANIDGVNAADISVSIDNGVNQGYIARLIPVPAMATQILTTKDTYFYLEEGCSIRAIASAAGDLDLVIGYEEIS